MKPTPRNAGFTIIEVMLAVAILVTLTALMWFSISSMFASRDAIQARSERFQQVRVTMNRMAEELAAGYMGGPQFGAEELPGEETFGAEEQEGEEDAAALAASAQEEIQLGFIGRDDEVSFTTFAHVRTGVRERASDHAEIGYFIRTDRDEEGEMVKMLMRREDVSTDDDLTSGGVIYKMVPEVESVLFEYWDPGTVELGTFEEIAAQGRWVKEWNTTRREFAGRLPTRVRITLTLPPQGNNEAPETFVTQTELHVTEVLEF